MISRARRACSSGSVATTGVAWAPASAPSPPSGCQDPAGSYDQGFKAGFNSGFNAGFNPRFQCRVYLRLPGGFSDGFGSTARHASLGWSSLAPSHAIAVQALPPACNPLFNQGFNTAFNVGFNSGFQRGFNSGFNSGFTGLNHGHSARHHR